ncbi:MAG: SDR family NAD(P)-dependent oxidoreductase [Christensenellales bacterium]
MENKKIAIITGASSGIGLATAELFASKGYKVFGISRGEFKSDLFKHYSCDVTNKQGMQAIFEEIFKAEGRIDVVINNAGMGISGAIEYLTESDLDKIMDVNVKGVILTSSLAIPYLRLSKGKIINTSSVASVIPIPFQACYSATKSAIESFSFALANELKPQGIKVTCVRPGDTKTGFTKNRLKTEVENEIYGKRITSSVKKMEKDEKNGKSPNTVAKVMLKVASKKNPPLAVTVGFGYKCISFLSKILSKRFINKIVYKLY